MDILTLLRANIRRKKGTFIGIMLLMIIVSMFLFALFSIKKNVAKSIDDALEEANAANVIMNIPNERFSEELLAKVMEHPLVDHVETVQAVLMRKHTIGGKEDNQSWLILPLNDTVTKQFNDDFSAYEDAVHPLSEKEIYLTQGIATNTGCKTGDDILFSTRYGEYTFTIKGFVVEPVCGSSMIGWKSVYVSKETFDKLTAEVDSVPNPDQTGNVTVVYVYKKADCGLSDGAFSQRINKDTGIQNFAYASTTMSDMKYYTGLFSEMCCSIMLAFALILSVVLVVIMAHNISVTIEMSYTELGILKAEGFTKGRIRILYALRYMLAQILGAVIGSALAIPLIFKFGNIFQPITGILADNKVDYVSGLSVLVLILIVSCLVIFLATRKIGKVSPVKALTGESRDVYFDNLLNAPISGSSLSLSLAYRQFSSKKRRYLVAILICALLMFFMLTINLMSSSMKSRSALEAIGVNITDVDVRAKDRNFTEEEMTELRAVAESAAPIRKATFVRTEYLTIEGNTIICSIYPDDSFMTIMSGRAPIYENEIVITGIIADMLDLKIGDKVTVARREYEAEFIVSGIFASISDTGRTFAMTFDSAKKLGVKGFSYFGICPADPHDAIKIGDAIKAKFGDTFSVEASSNMDDDSSMKSISMAVDVMRYTIYLFSILFVLVVVSMICSRIFAQERRDLGIYKAIGFTSGKLRLLFAIRFLIVAAIGSAIGCVMSLLLSETILNKLLYSMGVCSFLSDYMADTVLIPLVLLIVGFFLFAYLVSGKVRKVQTRELVIE